MNFFNIFKKKPTSEEVHPVPKQIDYQYVATVDSLSGRVLQGS